jgi:hypothetical protein
MPIHRRLALTERSNNPHSDLSQPVYDSVKRVTAEPGSPLALHSEIMRSSSARRLCSRSILDSTSRR